jgi:flavin-dependent dehydrogenase
VRKPVARLPSGALILGMADAVVLNDPITGQGSNNAAKAARIYLKRILDNGNKPFDAAWMQQTFTTTGPMRSSSPAGPTPCCSRRLRM